MEIDKIKIKLATIECELNAYKFDLYKIQNIRNERAGLNKWTSKYGELTRRIKGIGIISNKRVKKLREEKSKILKKLK